MTISMVIPCYDDDAHTRANANDDGDHDNDNDDTGMPIIMASMTIPLTTLMSLSMMIYNMTI